MHEIEERRAASRQAEIGVEWFTVGGLRIGIEVSPDGARWRVMSPPSERHLQRFRPAREPLAAGWVEGNGYPWGEPYLTQDEPRRDLPIAVVAGIVERYKRIVRRNEVTR